MSKPMSKPTSKSTPNTSAAYGTLPPLTLASPARTLRGCAKPTPCPNCVRCKTRGARHE